LKVESNGYAWWYVDGISDDGSKAISIIGFIGSVFSPWYRWAGRKNPHNHSCINLAMYGKGWRWTMTERGEKALEQSSDQLKIGPSSFVWDNQKLKINIDEISTPHMNRIKGTVTIDPSIITNVEIPLTDDGAHIWRPFAPTAQIKVELNRPGWTWSGHGYFDANFGTRALEQDFSYWTWARFPQKNGSIAFYEANRRKKDPLSIALKFHKDGKVEKLVPPPKATLSRSLWLIKRETRADEGYKPKQVKHMLDAPFYTRSAVKTKIFGEETIGVHETLDLDRFANPLIKPLLAVRVPRRSKWRTN
jgi:carotenoid 1,2-hydratase